MASTVPLCPCMSSVCSTGSQLYAQWARALNRVSPPQHTTTPLKRPPFNTCAGTEFVTCSKSNNQWLLYYACAMKEQAATASRQSHIRAKCWELLHRATCVPNSRQALQVLLPPMLNHCNWKGPNSSSFTPLQCQCKQTNLCPSPTSNRGPEILKLNC